MSGDDLRVTTTHVSELAVKHARVAAGIRSATSMVEGVDVAVQITHGSIAAASASALATALAARRIAGSRMAAISDDLCDKLSEAAKRYGQVDEAMSDALRSQAQGGQT